MSEKMDVIKSGRHHGCYQTGNCRPPVEQFISSTGWCKCSEVFHPVTTNELCFYLAIDLYRYLGLAFQIQNAAMHLDCVKAHDLDRDLVSTFTRGGVGFWQHVRLPLRCCFTEHFTEQFGDGYQSKSVVTWIKWSSAFAPGRSSSALEGAWLSSGLCVARTGHWDISSAEVLSKLSGSRNDSSVNKPWISLQRISLVLR